MSLLYIHICMYVCMYVCMYKGPLAAHALEARAWGASLCGMPAPVLRRTRVGTHSCAGGREEEGGKEGRREREREREREERRERESARAC